MAIAVTRKDRTQNHKRNSRNDNIQQSFYKQILRLRIIPANTKHRQVEHMHVMCTGHNGVTDAWYYKYSNVVFYTVFQNNIPVAAVDAAQKPVLLSSMERFSMHSPPWLWETALCLASRPYLPISCSIPRLVS